MKRSETKVLSQHHFEPDFHLLIKRVLTSGCCFTKDKEYLLQTDKPNASQEIRNPDVGSHSACRFTIALNHASLGCYQGDSCAPYPTEVPLAATRLAPASVLGGLYGQLNAALFCEDRFTFIAGLVFSTQRLSTSASVKQE